MVPLGPFRFVVFFILIMRVATGVQTLLRMSHQSDLHQSAAQNIWPGGGCNKPNIRKDGSEGCYGGERCFFLEKTNPRPSNPGSVKSSGQEPELELDKKKI